MSFYEIKDGYMLLKIRVTPNAKRNGFEGIWNDTHLRLALRAPAVDGKANEVVVEFLSEFCRIKKSNIQIVSGQTNRCKIIKLEGNLSIFNNDFLERMK